MATVIPACQAYSKHVYASLLDFISVYRIFIILSFPLFSHLALCRFSSSPSGDKRKIMKENVEIVIVDYANLRLSRLPSAITGHLLVRNHGNRSRQKKKVYFCPYLSHYFLNCTMKTGVILAFRTRTRSGRDRPRRFDNPPLPSLVCFWGGAGLIHFPHPPHVTSSPSPLRLTSQISLFH